MVSLMGFSQSLIGRHLACLKITDEDVPLTLAVQQKPANEDRGAEAVAFRKAQFEVMRPQVVIDLSRVCNDVPAGPGRR